VKVFVVPRGADSNGLQERLLQFCRERMPQQLIPKEIIVLRALPKNSAGKVLKSNLRPLSPSL
jgi:acyl-CoA synthetase (AMP-forming)/AMP-acid ligase II